MKQVVIVSGKGGTGKTSFTSSLAHAIASDGAMENLILVDADVDAANLNLILTPDILTETPYSGGALAEIDPAICTACGICERACHFSAISHANGTYQVDHFGCEGCTLCVRVCPVDAISMKEQQNGNWYHSRTRFGECFHADLFPGQGNSGKLVTEIKQQAEQRGKANKSALMLIDGPPGIGCPVIAAITGVDLAVIVTEPSASGLNDLERILRTLQHFQIPALVVLNKSDISQGAAHQLLAFCEEEQVPVIGKIPFATTIVEAMIQSKTLQEYDPDSRLAETIQEIWHQIKTNLNKGKK